MDVDDRILKAVDALYGAALDFSLWPDALDAVGGLAGGVGAIVLSVRTASASSIASNNLGDAAADYASGGWWDRDALRDGARRLNLGKGLYSHHDLVTDEVVKRHPFFREFLPQHGLQAVATFFVKSHADALLSVTVPRASRRGEFESADLAMFRALGPHAARALSIATQIARSSTGAAIDALLDRCEFATLLVNRKLRVQSINQMGRSMIGSGFTIDHGVLRATTAAGQQALDAVLHRAFEAPLSSSCQSLVPRPGGIFPFLVQAFRIRRGLATSILDLLSEDLACVIFIDTTARSRLDPSASLRAMGLTGAEARVAAALGNGDTPGEVAERLCITVGTVRIHLKSIFGKLDLRRQSDLTRLVGRLTVFE